MSATSLALHLTLLLALPLLSVLALTVPRLTVPRLTGVTVNEIFVSKWVRRSTVRYGEIQ